MLLSGCVHEDPYAYRTPYDEPLVSPGMKFLSLPGAVQNTIRAQAGVAEIDDINRHEAYQTPYYKVSFIRWRMYPPLYVAADGSVLNPDLTVAKYAPEENYAALAGHGGGLTIGDLPSQVVNTIQARAKSQEISHIEQTTVNDRRIYEVYFKGEDKSVPLRIDQDGKIVEAATPATTIKTHY